MPFVFKRLALFMSIAAAFAAEKEAPFKANPAASYAHHQTNDKVTIGVEAFNTQDQAKTAFGKLNPYQYGLLPVLVVIQNDGDQTIRLDGLKAEYVGAGGNRVEATPAKDIRYLYSSGKKPMVIAGTTGPAALTREKHAMAGWQM